MEYQGVTETIIGCAYRVYNKMEFGFLESVYESGKPVGLILNFGKKLKLNVKSRPALARRNKARLCLAIVQ